MIHLTSLVRTWKPMLWVVGGGMWVAIVNHSNKIAPEVTVTPTDNGAALINPDMGWIGYYFNNSLKSFAEGIDKGGVVTKTCDPGGGNCKVVTDTAKFQKKSEDYIKANMPGMSVMYFRLAWSDIETKEGVYDWSVLDLQIDRWSKAGFKIALRATASENRDPYATPKWVFDQGAKVYRWDTKTKHIDPNGNCYEPDFGDPIFLAKLDDFVKEFAKKYDGDPRIIAVDIGSFGVYGEGHTGSSTKVGYDQSVVQKHIDIHRKYFQKTPVVVNDDIADHQRDMTPDAFGNLTGRVPKRDNDIVQYAQRQGLWFRDDSIIVNKKPERAYYDAYMADWFYKTTPVTIEPNNYTPPKPLPTPTDPLPESIDAEVVGNGWCNPNRFFDAVEAYHASYVGANWFPMPFLMDPPQSNWFSMPPLHAGGPRFVGLKGLMSKIAQRMGYRLQYTNLSWPSEITPGKEFRLKFALRNNGVAPCYPGGFARIALVDSSGAVKASWQESNFNVRDLETGPVDSATAHEASPHFNLPSAGTYTVMVSVVNEKTKEPFQLPYDNGKDGSYPVGTLKVGG